MVVVDYDFIDNLKNQDTRAVVKQRLAFNQGNYSLWRSILLELVHE